MPLGVTAGASEGGKNAAANRSADALASHRVVTCDKAAPVGVVVLHLRARYVSKAAILTLPIRSVSVENRSPA
ncbi:MAG TPA: hypothetical protein VGO54_12615 [Bradyrhizobium sp.]|nr:hypothetical protein [Bradyrhizobium sp.]